MIWIVRWFVKAQNSQGSFLSPVTASCLDQYGGAVDVQSIGQSGFYVFCILRNINFKENFICTKQIIQI